MPTDRTTDVERRREAFARLHETGCFVIPNPWDVGSARLLRHLGFPALATTSAGFQFSRGTPDSVWGTPRAAVLAHVAEIVTATDLPVSADFQSGYADDADGVAASVVACVETGIAGLSIEDATGEPERPLYDAATAVRRVAAARRAIDGTGARVLLTARAEAYLVGHPTPLDESIRRLVAYADAGADVLFAPGVRDRAEIAAIVAAVAPKPVNVLVSGPMGVTVADLAALGVRRVSVGSALARVALGAFLRAARSIVDRGTFDDFAQAASFTELNAVFGAMQESHR